MVDLPASLIRSRAARGTPAIRNNGGDSRWRRGDAKPRPWQHSEPQVTLADPASGWPRTVGRRPDSDRVRLLQDLPAVLDHGPGELPLELFVDLVVRVPPANPAAVQNAAQLSHGTRVPSVRKRIDQPRVRGPAFRDAQPLLFGQQAAAMVGCVLRSARGVPAVHFASAA